ncbi:uncharacterized protein TNCV_1035311 [Trichonephila clavipes]|nr:uncharacterized protein TNCV_1035311 [Trichonephila clavipes]
MSNVWDDRSVCGPTWHVPSSSSSWMKTDDGGYWSIYSNFGDGKNWSTHRTHPIFHPETLIPDFLPIPKIKEPIRGRRFATREDIVNTVCQQVTLFTHVVANAEADGIQSLPHHWQRVVPVVGDYIEGL